MRARLLHTPLPLAVSSGIFAATPAAQFVRAFKGHSGAEIALHALGRTSLVRKTAGVPAQNMRLMDQSAHQRELSACGLRFPRTLREGVDERGHAFFEMEYIPGRSLASIVCEASPFDPAETAKVLERTLRFFQMTEQLPHPQSIFRDKLARIATVVPAAATAVARLQAMDWADIPASISHGDMTLENILLCPSRGVVFIDCDKGFASSWWLDVAKLCQDTLGHWCMRQMYRTAPSSAAWLNARQRLDRMAIIVTGIAASLDPGLPARLPQLTALHLLRTLPYTKDEAQLAFVLDRTAQLLDTAS